MITFMEQGLHNEPARLRSVLQEAVQTLEAQPGITRIALVYGLCSGGLAGISPRRCRLAMPRAHDCITILLGSRDRYDRYVREHPGTYWYSPGWNRCHLPPGPERYRQLAERYTAQYGPDNAQYLMETEQSWYRSYRNAAWVDMGCGAIEAGIEQTRQCARWLNWSFERLRGDRELLLDLLAGRWDQDRFVIVEPGQAIEMTGDENILTAVTIDGQNIGGEPDGVAAP
ncbi:MAG: DUF1638 domain-containing protein [Phycisphaeraceae bacterium]|nr:DUF1638 domain-containing protein [Phycisphaeraceae bacterium]